MKLSVTGISKHEVDRHSFCVLRQKVKRSQKNNRCFQFGKNNEQPTIKAARRDQRRGKLFLLEANAWGFRISADILQAGTNTSPDGLAWAVMSVW